MFKLRLGIACFNDTTHDCEMVSYIYDGEMVSYIYNCKHKYVLINYIYAFFRFCFHTSRCFCTPRLIKLRNALDIIGINVF